MCFNLNAARNLNFFLQLLVVVTPSKLDYLNAEYFNIYLFSQNHKIQSNIIFPTLSTSRQTHSSPTANLEKISKTLLNLRKSPTQEMFFLFLFFLYSKPRRKVNKRCKPDESVYEPLIEKISVSKEIPINLMEAVKIRPGYFIYLL